MNEDEIDVVRILTADGDLELSMKDFVKHIKTKAGEGQVNILAYGRKYTTILYPTGATIFTGKKEKHFWDSMERYGWSSGQNPRNQRNWASAAD